jgi:hypothetical protein
MSLSKSGILSGGFASFDGAAYFAATTTGRVRSSVDIFFLKLLISPVVSIKCGSSFSSHICCSPTLGLRFRCLINPNRKTSHVSVVPIGSDTIV